MGQPTALEELQVILGADISDYEKKLDRAGKAQKKFGDDLQSVGDELTKKVTLPLLGLAAAFVTLAAEQQASDQRIASSLSNIGVSYDKVSGQVHGTIDSLEKLTAFDDHDLSESFSSLLLITKNYQLSLAALPVAADLARAKHIDLAEATNLVAKAMVGNSEALKRYGIQITAGAQGLLVLDQLQRRVGGSAEAYGQTVEGTFKNLINQTSDVAKAFGAGLLPIALKVFQVLTDLAEYGQKLGAMFSALPISVRATIVGLLAVVAAVGPLLVIVGKLIVIWPALVALFTSGAAAMGTFLVTAGQIVVTVAAVVAVFMFFYANGKQIADGIAALFLSMAGDVLGALASIGEGLASLIAKAPLVSNSMKAWAADMAQNIRIAADAAKSGSQELAENFSKTDFIGNTKQQFQDLGTWLATFIPTLNASTPPITPAVNTAPAMSMWTKFTLFMQSTSADLAKQMTASFASIGASMVSSLAQGTFDGQKLLLDFAVKTLEMIVEWAISAALAAWGLSEALKAAMANPLIAGAVILGLIGVVAGLSAAYKSKVGGAALAQGGMTMGQMQATIGDNPSGHEVVMPLDSPRTTNALAKAMPDGNGDGEQTIIIKIGEEEISRAVVRGMPAILRLEGIA